MLIASDGMDCQFTDVLHAHKFEGLPEGLQEHTAAPMHTSTSEYLREVPQYTQVPLTEGQQNSGVNRGQYLRKAV